MKEDRPGVLVCARRADRKIVLNAPYDFRDHPIRRQDGITAPGRASNKPEGGIGDDRRAD